MKDLSSILSDERQAAERYAARIEATARDLFQDADWIGTIDDARMAARSAIAAADDAVYASHLPPLPPGALTPRPRLSIPLPPAVPA